MCGYLDPYLNLSLYLSINSSISLNISSLFLFVLSFSLPPILIYSIFKQNITSSLSSLCRILAADFLLLGIAGHALEMTD